MNMFLYLNQKNPFLKLVKVDFGNIFTSPDTEEHIYSPFLKRNVKISSQKVSSG
jgi:hypothetical protein